MDEKDGPFDFQFFGNLRYLFLGTLEEVDEMGHMIISFNNYGQNIVFPFPI